MNLDATSGDLVLTSAPPNGGARASLAGTNITFQDVSIRTQVRLLTGGPGGFGAGDLVGLQARGAGAVGYGAGIAPNGNISIVRSITGGFVDDVNLAFGATGLDVFNSDIHLQFDVIGTTLSLTAWADGTPQPAIPQLSVIDTGILGAGAVGVIGQRAFASTTAFRFVEVIPEPSSVLLLGAGLAALGWIRRRGTLGSA